MNVHNVGLPLLLANYIQSVPSAVPDSPGWIQTVLKKNVQYIQNQNIRTSNMFF